MIYYISYFFFKTLSAIFFPLKVVGREHLPADTGFILAGNHISNLDPFILGLASRRRLSYVTKDTLFRNKILSYLLYRVDAFPIKRGASDFRAMRETLRRLKKGLPVVLFPEGTRQPAGGTDKKVHEGIGFIVSKSGVPVIPAYIKDSQKVLAPGTKVLKRHRVTVVFGPPLRFNSTQSYSDIAHEVMYKISGLSFQSV
ncbi:MAG: 1-acyl-sn-glycerol-3-phosphate acyltransferase [Candidatus Omnitrophica bacterium]|nr:1-acyl-sn-glycerol-3-phosphate acyltransferase [Candidatus Omnitrophota bacterium]